MRRREKEFFAKADFRVIHIDNEGCILERSTSSRKMILVINRTEDDLEIPYELNCLRKPESIFEMQKEQSDKLKPYSGIILEISWVLREWKKGNFLPFSYGIFDKYIQ